MYSRYAKEEEEEEVTVYEQVAQEGKSVAPIPAAGPPGAYIDLRLDAEGPEGREKCRIVLRMRKGESVKRTWMVGPTDRGSPGIIVYVRELTERYVKRPAAPPAAARPQVRPCADAITSPGVLAWLTI